MSMSDDALVTFGMPVVPGALPFTDVGYMPVNMLTIGSTLQDLKGKLDGLFIDYTAKGVQHFYTNGAPPTIDYTDLKYRIMGYKGDAIFTHAADGTPMVSDIKHLTVLAKGDLITGSLGFTPNGGIAGQIHTSMQINGQAAGTLDIQVAHEAHDIGFTATGGLTLSDGKLVATFIPLNVG